MSKPESLAIHYHNRLIKHIRLRIAPLFGSRSVVRTHLWTVDEDIDTK